MSVVARVLAGVAALCGIVFGLAGLVRTAALAADDTVVWPLPQWWTDLIEGSSSWVVAVVAAATAVAAALYVVLAFRELGGRSAPATARVGDADVKPAALERLIAQRLAAEVPGLAVGRVRVSWAGEGWDVDTIVDVRPLGLDGVRAQAVEVAEAELRRATGRGVARLALEVRRFVGAEVVRAGG